MSSCTTGSDCCGYCATTCTANTPSSTSNGISPPSSPRPQPAGTEDLSHNGRMTARRRQYSIMWRTVDFRPAPPGWRVYAFFEEKLIVEPIAGWLIQDAFLYDSESDAVVPDETAKRTGGPERRVIPGISVAGYSWSVEPIDEGTQPDDHTWQILPPGAPEPSPEEIDRELQRRAKSHKERAE